MSDEFDDAFDEGGRRGRLIPPSAVDEVRRPKVPRLMSRLYRAAAQPLRARMLRCLIRPLGPLGLAAIASGAFADVLHRSGERGLDLPLDSLGRYSNDQLVELVQFVQQVSPEAIQQVTSIPFRCTDGQCRLHRRRGTASGEACDGVRSGEVEAIACGCQRRSVGTRIRRRGA